jgi:hypothetical protein
VAVTGGVTLLTGRFLDGAVTARLRDLGRARLRASVFVRGVAVVSLLAAGADAVAANRGNAVGILRRAGAAGVGTTGGVRGDGRGGGSEECGPGGRRERDQ